MKYFAFNSIVLLFFEKNSCITFDSGKHTHEYGEFYPFKENLPLNGIECKIVIYDIPRKVKASLSTNLKAIDFESTTTFYGNNGADDLNFKETWTNENGGNSLKIEYTISYSEGPTNGTLWFDRVK